MYHRILRSARTISAGLLLLALTGCSVAVFELQVINAGDYPLTSVRLIKYHEDSAEQAQAFEEAENLLPRDAAGNTIALASGNTVMAPHILREDIYIAEVSIFVQGQRIEHIEPVPVELKGLPENALVIMRVNYYWPDSQAAPVFEIDFFYY